MPDPADALLERWQRHARALFGTNACASPRDCMWCPLLADTEAYLDGLMAVFAEPKPIRPELGLQVQARVWLGDRWSPWTRADAIEQEHAQAVEDMTRLRESGDGYEPRPGGLLGDLRESVPDWTDEYARLRLGDCPCGCGAEQEPVTK